MRAQFMVSTDFLATEGATADDAALGVWLRLCAKSATSLWAGRFAGAAGWNDLVWMRMAGVRRKSAQAIVAAGLATWDNGDLVLVGYDLHGETIWRRKSDGGAKGAALKWSKNHKDSHIGIPSRSGDGTPIKESHQDSDKANAIAIAKASGGGAPPLRTRDPAASTLDFSPTDPEDDMPSPLRAHGCEIDHADPDKQAKLRAEWREACKAMTDTDIEAVFQHCKDPIRFAREFVAARKAWILATGWSPVDRDEVERRKRAADEHFAALERQRAENEAQQAKAKASPVNDRARAQRLLAFMADDVQDWDEILDAATKEHLTKLRAALAEDKPVGLIMVRLNLPAALLAAMDAPAGGQGAA